MRETISKQTTCNNTLQEGPLSPFFENILAVTKEIDEQVKAGAENLIPTYKECLDILKLLLSTSELQQYEEKAEKVKAYLASSNQLFTASPQLKTVFEKLVSLKTNLQQIPGERDRKIYEKFDNIFKSIGGI